jgi:hypothetical protein
MLFYRAIVEKLNCFKSIEMFERIDVSESFLILKELIVRKKCNYMICRNLLM